MNMLYDILDNDVDIESNIDYDESQCDYDDIPQMEDLMSYTNDVEKWFDSINVSDIITLYDGRRYLKPIQDKAHHLDGMFISLDNGGVVHFSRVYEEIVRHEDEKCRGYYGE